MEGVSTVATRRRQDLATKPPANPEGKGLNGFLLDWHRTEPRGVVAKPQRQVLAEYFTSMLVLSARFKYQPAIGVINYLYRERGGWALSLIAPHEWRHERFGDFVGTCVLRPDMTWTIDPSPQLSTHAPLVEALGRFFDAFAETLDTDLGLEEVLPFYVRHMPYWQRLHASALSRSIRAAVTLGGQRSIRARDWLPVLPAVRSSLPAAPPTAMNP